MPFKMRFMGKSLNQPWILGVGRMLNCCRNDMMTSLGAPLDLDTRWWIVGRYQGC
jgi:hypothetical protein